MTFHRSCAGWTRASMTASGAHGLTVSVSTRFTDCRVKPGNDRAVRS
jgi:hypothetical protein